MKFRNPIFRGTNGRLYIRPLKYVAPVLIVPEGAPQGLRNFLIDMNLAINSILPTWVLRRLDGRKGAKEYWAKIRKQEQRDRPEENFND